jgi:hypothetical protein
VLMHSCPFTAAHCPLHKRSSAQRTRHMSKAKNTVIPSDSPPPCPTQPLSSRGPLRASLWSPADEAGPTKAPKRPRRAPSRASYAVPCLVLLSLLLQSLPRLTTSRKTRERARPAFDSLRWLRRPMTNAAPVQTIISQRCRTVLRL